MNYRKALIKILTFLGGIYFFLKFVLPEELPLFGESFHLKKYDDVILTGFTAVGTVAIGIGVVILLKYHGGTLLHLRKNWAYSATLLFGLFVMFLSSGLAWNGNLNDARREREYGVLRDFAQRIKDDHEQNVQGVEPVSKRVALLLESLRNSLEKSRREVALFRSELSDSEIDQPQRNQIGELEAALSLGEVQRAGLAAATFQPEKFDALMSLRATIADLAVKTREALTLRQERSLSQKFYHLIHQGFFVSLGSAMFSLLAFYIASAAFRAFRVRSFEAALMMCAAVVIIFGQLPPALFGDGESTLEFFKSINAVRQWLLTQLNSAAFRSIEIGAGIAGLVMAVRMWLSIESESFSAGKERDGRAK